jgi:hypothetical protein
MNSMSGYIIYKNLDRTEGRGPCVPTNIMFEKEIDALAFIATGYFAETYGVQGCAGGPSNIVHGTFRQYTSLDDFFGHKKSLEEIEKEKALNKLTDREKKLLGL